MVCRLLGISKIYYYRRIVPQQRLERKYRHLRRDPIYGYHGVSQELRQEYRIVVNVKLPKRLLRLWGVQLPRTIRKVGRGYVYRLLWFLGGRANLLFRVKASGCLEEVTSALTELVYRAGKSSLTVHFDQFRKLVFRCGLSIDPDVSRSTHSLHPGLKRV